MQDLETYVTNFEVVPPTQCCPCEEPTTLSEEEIVNSLKSSIDDVWTFHLETSNYVEHIAFEKYYKGALELVDSLIEALISSGKRMNFGRKFSNLDMYQEEKSQYFVVLRNKMYYAKGTYWSNLSEVTSICDSIDQLISSTIYMLTNLTHDNSKISY